MLLKTLLIHAALVAATSAKLLYVSSYSGNVTTLNLTHTNNRYTLDPVASNNACAPNASFLTYDQHHQNLFCVNEGIVDKNGSLVSFKADTQDGTLQKVNSTLTPAAPVNSAIYNGKNGSQLLAVAHYAWGLTTYKVNPKDASFATSQVFNFTLAKPGPNAARQAAPHPHQVLLDPKKRYFLVPDLGADLVRVFHIDPVTLQVSPRDSIPVVPGSGPRHGDFEIVHNSANGEEHIYFYLVTELASTITSYHVTYLPADAGLKLDPVMSMKTYGNNTNPIFNGTAAAEIVIDSGEIIVSNRNATLFHISNPDPKNLTAVPSDTLATFKLSEAGDGNFANPKLTPAGGSFPRQFSLSPEGDLVAVGLQNDGRVVLYGRCGMSGGLGKDILASVDIEGQVTSVVWGD